jgi:hypothetical protein
MINNVFKVCLRPAMHCVRNFFYQNSLQEITVYCISSLFVINGKTHAASSIRIALFFFDFRKQNALLKNVRLTFINSRQLNWGKYIFKVKFYYKFYTFVSLRKCRRFRWFAAWCAVCQMPDPSGKVTNHRQKIP